MRTLWCSRELDFVYVEFDQHNPSLDRTSPDAPLRWFWTVDTTFAAWVVRAAAKASAANATIPNLKNALAAIRECVENTNGAGSWSEVERRAMSAPVVLPGSTIINHAIVFARFGMGPKWEGWEKERVRRAGE